MKLIDRLILIIVGLVLLAVAALGFAVSFGFISVSQLAYFFANISIDPLILTSMIVVCVLLVIFALKVIFVRPKKEKISVYTIHKGGDGEVCVAISAIESTVTLSLAKFDQVMEAKVRVIINSTGIAIMTKIAIPTGVVLPSLMSDVKENIKAFTEEYTGVPVNQIKIVVTEYKNIDTINEKKKMAAVKKQEEKKLAVEAKNSESGSQTHTRILLSHREEETETNTVPTEEENLQDSTEQE